MTICVPMLYSGHICVSGSHRGFFFPLSYLQNLIVFFKAMGTSQKDDLKKEIKECKRGGWVNMQQKDVFWIRHKYCTHELTSSVVI